VLDAPYAMIGVGVVCADDDERAGWLAAPGALSYLRLRSGRPGPFPSPEEAAAYPYTPAERVSVEGRLRNTVVGSPGTVRGRLEALAAETGVDELMVTTVVHDHADRVRSYELVAEAWGYCTPSKSTTNTSVSLGPTGPLPDAP
jgi:alkanesulfonate monooxygenase SsuD/methylene tetrahydromethanopterin reductase-like flavin-dependent oxidoreductase (luciferase family)